MADTDVKVPETELEPHLKFHLGSYVDVWHRFKPPIYEKRGRQQHIVLVTKCGKRINDHWNVRTTFNPRYTAPCALCFTNGITSEGRPKPPQRHTPSGRAPDAEGDGAPAAGEPGNPQGSVPLTSTPEPLVSESDDAGDGGAAHQEGSGVLGAGDSGHVEELPEERDPGDSSVAGSTEPEGGQGSKVREPSKKSSERPAGQRKPTDNASR